MGIFIKVILKENASLEDRRLLVTKCPVDIFKDVDGQIVIDEEAEDECTLCGLCWEAVPGGVEVQKLY